MHAIGKPTVELANNASGPRQSTHIAGTSATSAMAKATRAGCDEGAIEREFMPCF